MSELPKLITIKQAAALLGVTPLTLRNWDSSGKLRALRHPMNNYRVYKKSEIEALIDSIQVAPAPIAPRKPSSGTSSKKLQVKHL